MFKTLLRPFYYYLKSIYFKFNPLIFNSYDKYWINQKKPEINLENYKYCVFISSKNNYSMFNDLVIKNFKIENLDIYNVDDNSTNEQKKIGKHICNLNNITFIENESIGLQMALSTLLNYLLRQDKKYNFILYISHDNYPISENFFYKLNQFVIKNNLEKFGCIGFNHLDYKYNKMEILNFKNNIFSLGHLGRSILTSLNGSKIPQWYNKENTNNFKNFLSNKPFAVESVSDMAFAINFKNLKKHIQFSDQYRLHCWADDICMQFLEKNLYNVTIPSFIFFNAFEIKSKYNLHFSSVYSEIKTSKKNNSIETYKRYWKKKWKWDRENLPSKDIINKYYSGSLIEKFYLHDINKGPLKTFNLII